jgi:hypothetical protein
MMAITIHIQNNDRDVTQRSKDEHDESSMYIAVAEMQIIFSDSYTPYAFDLGLTIK